MSWSLKNLKKIETDRAGMASEVRGKRKVSPILTLQNNGLYDKIYKANKIWKSTPDGEISRTEAIMGVGMVRDNLTVSMPFFVCISLSPMYAQGRLFPPPQRKTVYRT